MAPDRITRTRKRNRDGFSLMEVIVAMTLVATVFGLLATFAISLGRRAHLNDLTTKRNLALAQQAGRIVVMPFPDVMLLTSGTTQMLIGDFTFNRRLTVTPAGPTRYQIKIVIAPVAAEFRPDSITIDRTRPASGTPLCTSC